MKLRGLSWLGVKVARWSPSINHLFFVDDSLVFYGANTTEWKVIKRLLDIYEKVLGQGINKQKWGIFVSSNTNWTIRNHLLDLAWVLVCSNQESYFGLPIMVGKNRYKIFETIKDKVWEKTNNWKNFYPSQAGKEVQLKSMVQALTTYAMSMFILQWKILKNMVSSMAKFWWNHINKSSGIH